MSTFNTKNYMAHGGNELVIGGKLTLLNGAEVTGFPASALPVATETALGGIKAEAATENDTVPVKIGTDGKLYLTAAEAQDESDATTVAALKEDFNELLAKLKDAGLMQQIQLV